MAKTNSGLLEFKDEQKVFVALDDETSEVKKAVVIDDDGAETDIIGVHPTGKKEITSTAEVNVANYATAQVVDEDLVAGNIKKDVDILGVVGSYEGVQPAGKKEITSTAEVNVANYATAQVVDADLVAGNIKKDVDILGVVGTYEAAASDFSTAEVIITSLNGNTVLIPYVTTSNGVSYLDAVVSDPGTYNVALYDGKASGAIFNPQGSVTVTGDIMYNDGIFLISGGGTIAITPAV